MSGTDSSLFYLKNEKYDSNLFYTHLLIFISNIVLLFILLYLFITEATNSGTLLPVFLLLVLTALLFALLAYNEYRGRSDFIQLTKSMLKYQHSPKFFYTGIISKGGDINYSNISAIRVIQIKTGIDIIDEKIKQAQFNPEAFFHNKKLILEIHLKDGRNIKMGERLPPGGLVQLAVLIEGRAKIESIYEKFQENFPNLTAGINEVVGKIKNVFSKGN